MQYVLQTFWGRVSSALVFSRVIDVSFIKEFNLGSTLTADVEALSCITVDAECTEVLVAGLVAVEVDGVLLFLLLLM